MRTGDESAGGTGQVQLCQQTPKPWERLRRSCKAPGKHILQSWQLMENISHSFTSSNVNISIQISNCSFLNPWLSILLEILWQCILLPCPFISLRRTPCHLLWPCLYSCISRKGEKRVTWIIFWVLLIIWYLFTIFILVSHKIHLPILTASHHAQT